MVNYRIFTAKEFTTGQSGSLDRAWGIMVNTPICNGTLYLEGMNGSSHTTMSLAYLPKNTPTPVYPANILEFSQSVAEAALGSGSVNYVRGQYSVKVDSGSVYLLA